MTGSLFPLLRAAAASEIAKAFGLAEGQAPTKSDAGAPPSRAPPTAQGPLADPLLDMLQSLKPLTQETGLAGLATPRPLATGADPSLLTPTLFLSDSAGSPTKDPAAKDRAGFANLAQTASSAQTSNALPVAFQNAGGEVGSAPLAAAKDQTFPAPSSLTERPAASSPAAQNEGLPTPASALKSALPGAMAEAMSYGAFPFTIGGSGASAASLVIFNAAMSPAWPPALRFNQTMDDLPQIRAAGSQFAQMTQEETAEFLAKMAAMFGFLLVVKKRLSRSLREENESILGLFALFGVAMDTLVKGMQLAFDLTAEQQEVLQRISVESGGQPSGRRQDRHRLKL